MNYGIDGKPIFLESVVVTPENQLYFVKKFSSRSEGEVLAYLGNGGWNTAYRVDQLKRISEVR